MCVLLLSVFEMLPEIQKICVPLETKVIQWMFQCWIRCARLNQIQINWSLRVKKAAVDASLMQTTLVTLWRDKHNASWTFFAPKHNREKAPRIRCAIKQRNRKNRSSALIFPDIKTSKQFLSGRGEPTKCLTWKNCLRRMCSCLSCWYTAVCVLMPSRITASKVRAIPTVETVKLCSCWTFVCSKRLGCCRFFGFKWELRLKCPLKLETRQRVKWGKKSLLNGGYVDLLCFLRSSRSVCLVQKRDLKTPWVVFPFAQQS